MGANDAQERLTQQAEYLVSETPPPEGRDSRPLPAPAEATLEVARRNRAVVAYSAYAMATVLALVLAYAARFDLAIPESYRQALLPQVAVLVLLRLGAARFLHLMAGRWRYVGVDDVLRLGAASTASSLVFFGVFRVVPGTPALPLSVVLIEWALFTLGVAGMWLLYRRAAETLWIRQSRNGGPPPRKLLIVGSGEAGNMLAREINRMPLNHRVVGFLDDDPLKQGTRVQGCPVLGGVNDADEVLMRVRPDEIAIAIPSATPAQLRRIVETLDPLNLPFKVLPGIRELVEGNGALTSLRPLRIEDLLGREPVSLALPRLAEDLRDRTVWVTGAAGSIGSELARQIAANGPARLVLVDQAESDLYFVDLELRESHPGLEITSVVGDILDEDRMRELGRRYPPERLYHAAAYKHVPLMEENPGEAVRNNTLGTWQLARLAGELGAGRFVLISTDKAADPVNVMGATKRAAELAVQVAQDDFPDTHFTAVRFGNVLGSNGSVIPLFQRQIAQGGPLTITDPEVTRFFMTIPEAVQLVLQAGLLDEARGGIAMLEMGEPVPIVELARNLVRLSGLRPEVDIDFVYTGLRPGEKLHETLQGTEEALEPTSLPSVYLVNSPREPNGETPPIPELMWELGRTGHRDRAALRILESLPVGGPPEGFSALASGSVRG